MRSNSTPRHVVGIDLGGTNCRIGIGDLLGESHATVTFATASSSLEHFLSRLELHLVELLHSNSLSLAETAQITIGIPGVVDPSSGRVSNVPKVAYLDGLNLGSIMSNRFKVNVSVENDVNVAAMAELVNSGSTDFAFIAIGTGIGMGLILNGSLRRGFKGVAGELGDIPIGASPRNIGLDSTFELLVGGQALETRYQEEFGDRKSLKQVFEIANHGDLAALAFIDNFAWNITVGIKAVCTIVGVEEIILGGGIGARVELFDRVAKNLSSILINVPKIRISKLGTSAGLVGALVCAVQEVNFRDQLSPENHLDG
jgi:glucokinase